MCVLGQTRGICHAGVQQELDVITWFAFIRFALNFLHALCRKPANMSPGAAFPEPAFSDAQNCTGETQAALPFAFSQKYAIIAVHIQQ